MSQISISFEIPVSVGVIPFDKPTVPIAETVSKITFEILVSSNVAISIIETITADIYKRNIAEACFKVSFGIERLKISGWVLWRAVARVDTKRTATVVIFIPPAVEPEPPPINISIVVRISLPGES